MSVARQRFAAPTAEAMEAFGGALARAVAPGTLVFLSGDLAAGKTTLVRGYLRALGHAGVVKSPTFTLVESYALADRSVHHFDLYRLADPEELAYLGFDDYLRPDADCLIEWPECGAGELPEPDLRIAIAFEGEAGRTVSVEAVGARGESCLGRLVLGESNPAIS